MEALRKAFSASFSFLHLERKLPEPEPFLANPRPMTGFLATMTDDQKKAAREYRGEEKHGDSAFAR